MRILVIDDDEAITTAVKHYLDRVYIVDTARTAKRGTHLAEIYEYDLIVLDLYLPDGNGTDITRSLRHRQINAPILMLSAESESKTKVLALDAGADDYLTKPYSPVELGARIRALFRRDYSLTRSNVLVVDTLTLDPKARTVKREDKIIKLRKKEFNILEYLIRNRGKVVKRDMILDHVWDDTGASFNSIVNVHIKYLRDHIDKPFNRPLIKTVYGVGYTIE